VTQDDDDEEDFDEEEENNDTMLELTSNEDNVQKTVTTTVTDPILLEYARIEMISRYTLVHEIEKQTQLVNTYRDSIADIDDVIQGWMKEYPDIDFEKLVIKDDNEVRSYYVS
jgi:hypothetical protein